MSDYRGEPGTIVELIQRDHRVIKGLLDRFDKAPLHDWGKLFDEFVGYCLRHEIAEAEVVFPALAGTVPGAEGVVDDCLSEQTALEARLSSMGDLDPTSLEFRDELAAVRDDQSRHSTHEEQVVLPMLRGQGIADLAQLARAYDAARLVAPSHPVAADKDGATAKKEPVAALASRIRSLLGHDTKDG